ncbi:hypothetical protein BAY40_06520 [Limosilactobacillus reuteri]|nr:hypothetical protein BAY40_06520 [Limosilactobacillus reuteri]
MRKAHPYGVQGRRPIASKYKRALKEKKIEAIRKWAKEKPAEESNSVYKSYAIQCIAFIF